VALATAIDEMLIAHRLMPEAPMGFRIEPDDLDPEGNLRLTRARAAHLLSLLKRPEFTDYSLSFAYKYPFDLDIPANRRLAVNYLRSVYEWFRSYGIQQKLFIRPGDEPATRQQFQEIRELAGLARTAHPEFRVGMTIDFHDRRTAQFLYGNVNRLIALYASFDPAEAAARRLAGDEIWTYTALVQNRDVPSPHWEIDFPLLNYREGRQPVERGLQLRLRRRLLQRRRPAGLSRPGGKPRGAQERLRRPFPGGGLRRCPVAATEDVARRRGGLRIPGAGGPHRPAGRQPRGD